ncbi:MAG: S1 RNA-binding domain-containing protein [Actinomycetota bacterium]|nr:S1 RNA-binding domain-containing protein [Actinomycetota bacterium]
MPAARHVVVDGSNIATEGNSLPSLKQLDEAVREYLRENPDDFVTVVVDATFGHRIPPEELEMFEQAEREGDIVSPPAGAIGRGDAFLLRVADRVGAVVLSNDSFQEFHGEYGWLFDKGRLIGGKPVPGVGWIFTPRSPVRGPKSRQSMKDAKRKQPPEQVEPEGSGLELAAERSRGKASGRRLQKAIATAAEEAVGPEGGARKRRRRRRGGELPSEPLNEPLTFINFIAAHSLGQEVEGVVEEFSSHGAFITAGGARCYLPLSAMGDPPPRSAREVLRKGESRAFVVQAFDAMRRGVELALPGFAHPSGAPTPETVEAEIHVAEELREAGAGPVVEAPARRGRPRPSAPRPDGSRRGRSSREQVAAEQGEGPGAGGTAPPVLNVSPAAQEAKAPRRAKAAAAKAAPHAPSAEHAKEVAVPKAATKVQAAQRGAGAPAAAATKKAASTTTAPKKAASPRRAASTTTAPKKAASPRRAASTTTAPKKAASPRRAASTTTAPSPRRAAGEVTAAPAKTAASKNATGPGRTAGKKVAGPAKTPGEETAGAKVPRASKAAAAAAAAAAASREVTVTGAIKPTTRAKKAGAGVSEPAPTAERAPKKAAGKAKVERPVKEVDGSPSAPAPPKATKRRGS